MRNSLSQHLNELVKPEERVDESLILGTMLATACIAYAIGPVMNSDFMKSVGSGLGNLLGGIGGMFGNVGGMFGLSGTKISDVKEILKKDPDDMTEKEKEILKKASNDPKLKKEFSTNDLKKINKAINGDSSSADDDEMSETDEKKLHDILKKKPEDWTPKEKKQLKEYNDKYNLSDSLSDAEYKKLKASGIAADDADDADESTPEEMASAMLALAAKANESEKDPEKKAKNQALLDIVTASAYDEDGNIIPMKDREAKMKELVGEDNWDSFKKDLDELNKNVKEDELQKQLEKVKQNLKADDIKTMLNDQKKNAKEANDRIKKENEERSNLEKEIEKLKNDPDTDSDKLKELQDKYTKLVNDSTLDKASPDTAKSAIERQSPKDDPKPAEKDDDKDDKDDPKPAEKTVDDVKKEYEQKEKDFEKEWEKKLDDAKDDEEGEKILADYEKAKKKLKAEKHKAMDSIDDNDDHDTDKDETKQGKYKVKDEEITDPDTGEKIKVKTYTGPRGGKFYYPDGKPKTPENKVYVHESVEITLNRYRNLKKYLLEKLK